MTATTDGLEHDVTAITDIRDGDSLHARTVRITVTTAPPERVSDTLLEVVTITRQVYDDPDRAPRGLSVRLAWVDTPESGDHPGYEQAHDDLLAWIHDHADQQIRLTTFGPGGFGRTLGDLYVLTPDGARDSASQWLMTVKGWPPYHRDSSGRRVPLPTPPAPPARGSAA